MNPVARAFDLILAARIPTALFSLPLPVAGALVASRGEIPSASRLALALGSILLLFVHVLLWNNAADLERDRLGAVRDFVAPASRTGRRGLLAAGAVALGLALGAGSVVSGPFLAGEILVAGLWLVYAFPPLLAKGRPLAGPVVHVVAGGGHVLLGALAAGGVSPAVAALALWFGLATAAGYLTHLVMDLDSDRGSGMRTAAVVFGERATLAASAGLFAAAAASAPLVLLAGGSAPGAAVLAATAAVAAGGGALLLRRGMSAERCAAAFRRLYRGAFLVGGALFVTVELLARR